MPIPKKQKKQQPRNAYSIFVDDYLERNQRAGRRMSRQQAFSEADTDWKALPREDKAYYEEKAAEEKAAARQNVGRIDSTGQLVSAVENEMEEQRREMEAKTDVITTVVRNLGSKEAVADLKFYMISFNMFCRTEKGDYLPAEVGLVEFSIAKGITQTYHNFIASGPIPTGYTFKCNEHSDRTHKIPVHDFDLAEHDYGVVYRRIWETINSCDGSPWNDVGDAVFCLPEDMAMTEYLLRKLSNGSRNLQRAVPVVYDITVLFVELCLFAEYTAFSTGLARDSLNRASFNYSPDVSCEWHAENDNQPYCSLGVCKRSCYLMADMLCPLYGVSLVPGFHVPDESNSNVLFTTKHPTPSAPTSRPTSSAKFRPSASSYVPSASVASTNRSSYLPQTTSHYVPSVAASVSSCGASSRYASAHSRPPSSYVQAACGPSNESFTVASGDFPSISGGSCSGRDSVLSNVSMSTQASIDHNPVYSSEIGSVSGSSAGDSVRIRDPTTTPFVMGWKGIGRGVPKQAQRRND